MKQNITLALDQKILKAARAFAAQRGTSISAMLSDELRMKIEQQMHYEQSKQIAFSMLNQAFPLGGQGIMIRDALHDRTALR
ncbi:MAG: hypothetical protein IV108_12585 [Burkholderiales bacterium]|nr:hypothetical protein [Burkholderiales bacterium]